MILLLASDASFLLDYMEDSAFIGATICKTFLVLHIVPAFLQAIGLIHVRPREIVDHWYLKPGMRQRLIIWIDDTPWEDPGWMHCLCL